MGIDHNVSTQFYVQGHLDGFYTVDTVKATAVSTGHKLSPNSLKFNEQKTLPVHLLSVHSQFHYHLPELTQQALSPPSLNLQSRFPLLSRPPP